jgi:hypothetical protein
MSRAYVNAVYQGIPASASRLEQIRECQSSDKACQLITQYLKVGWPERSSLDSSVKPYWPVRGEITIQSGLLSRGIRLIIPKELHSELLQRIHEGHLGITKCRARAKAAIWWPGLSCEINDLVKNCDTCVKRQKDRAEPLIPTEFPQRPWQRVATDLLEWNGSSYFVLVDYYSRYIELAKLYSMSSASVIRIMKSIFARHGVPETVMSDNGPQYISEEFQEFAKDYDFSHVTSSPRYPQSNGAAEKAVQTLKDLLKSNDDPHRALLSYRSTPLENGYSPAELLFNRRIRSTVPTLPSNLEPRLPDRDVLRTKEESQKQRQKRNYDSRHRAVERESLSPGDQVYVRGDNTPGTVLNAAGTPRSFVVQVPTGTIRRNRRQLALKPQQCEDTETDPPTSSNGHSDNPPATPRKQQDIPQDKPANVIPAQPSVRGTAEPYSTRSGRAVNPPSRLDL